MHDRAKDLIPDQAPPPFRFTTLCDTLATVLREKYLKKYLNCVARDDSEIVQLCFISRNQIGIRVESLVIRERESQK